MKMGRILSWFLVVLWMGVIFLVSSQPDLPHPPQPFLSLLLSSGGHFLEYAVLAFLIYRAQGGSGAGSWRRYGVVLVLTVAYALSDEGHQSFVPHRKASFLDVAVDGMGALTALLLIHLWLLYRLRRAPTEPA